MINIYGAIIKRTTDSRFVVLNASRSGFSRRVALIFDGQGIISEQVVKYWLLRWTKVGKICV